MMIELVQPRSEDDWRRARRLVETYAASLDVDLSFQNFNHELEHFTSEYGPPAGVFLLAEEEDGVSLGGIVQRRFSEGTGEVKRLYVSPAVRGRRVGRLLAEGLLAIARSLGYTRLVLDTRPSMQEAQALYRSLGFRPSAVSLQSRAGHGVLGTRASRLRLVLSPLEIERCNRPASRSSDPGIIGP